MKTLLFRFCIAFIITTGLTPFDTQAQPLSPATQPKFVNSLPIPPAIDVTAGGDTLEMTITEFTQNLGLRDPNTGEPMQTKVWGYGAQYRGQTLPPQYPGPTIVAQKDVPLNVFWYNKLVDENGTLLPHLLPVDRSIHWALHDHEGVAGVPTVTHLHGGHTESASDGLPEAWYTPDFQHKGEDFRKGEVEPYHYANDQEAATIWYHDHALGITRLNVYAGLAGFYVLADPLEQNLQNTNQLPAAPYDLGLAIQDRLFTADGQLFYPSEPEVAGAPSPSVLPEFFGNIILVNGKAWPVLDVEPRQYRFRLLNGSDSRFYNLFLSQPLSLVQIAADDGLLDQPVSHDHLLLAPGERKEVIIDFSNPALFGSTIIMRNNAKTPYPKGTPPNPNAEGQIMAFRVTKPLNSDYPLTPVPSQLRANLPAPAASTKVRKLILYEATDEYGRLKPMLGTLENGVLGWDEPITENPALNSTEIWEIYNLTEDAHPIHLHLVTFRVINTQKFSATFADESKGLLSNVRLIGNPKPPEPGQNGFKDTYPIQPGEVARLVAKFDREGLYVWHCHILSHEDHEMMRPYYVGNMPTLASNQRKQTSITNSPEGNKQDQLSEAGLVNVYPNPFSGAATLQFKIAQPSEVFIRMVDLKGRVIQEMSQRWAEAGEHNVSLDGSKAAPGVYLCEVTLNGKVYRSRIAILK